MIKDIIDVNNLLNNYLSYGLSNTDKLLDYINDGKVICKFLLINKTIVGFIKGSIVIDFDKLILNNLGYNEKAIEFLLKNNIESFLSLDLCVIEPSFRGLGYFEILKNNLFKECNLNYVCGIVWDKNRNLLSSLSLKNTSCLFIDNYWLEDNLYCGYCKSICYCPAIIFIDKLR